MASWIAGVGVLAFVTSALLAPQVRPVLFGRLAPVGS
jgi:hypothetical protein